MGVYTRFRPILSWLSLTPITDSWTFLTEISVCLSSRLSSSMSIGTAKKPAKLLLCDGFLDFCRVTFGVARSQALRTAIETRRQVFPATSSSSLLLRTRQQVWVLARRNPVILNFRVASKVTGMRPCKESNRPPFVSINLEKPEVSRTSFKQITANHRSNLGSLGMYLARFR